MSNPGRFDGVAESDVAPKKARLCGSARLTYTILAFLSMVVQLCLRNSFNIIILYMIKHEPANNSTSGSDGTANNLEEIGTLIWTRSEEFNVLGAFYYGYLITLPISGRLADKFGGKLLFIHSVTAQAVVFMLIPFFAEFGYYSTFVVRGLQGLISGCGNPALYQLFSVWAHPTERVAFLSFAYGGFSVGAFIVFPISNYLCKFGWQIPYYIIGGVSLFFGICCQWLVYSSLEQHPRLSKEEYDYLKANKAEKSSAGVPWKSVFTSIPVYAFIFTHFFHTYGIMVFVQLISRFFKEAMTVPLQYVGLVSSVSFMGAVVSKVITITSCGAIEQIPGLNLTLYRRILYVLCNLTTILSIVGIILSNSSQLLLVSISCFIIGIFTDIAFAGAYWPSLLYVAPSFAGLICGIANCFATLSGILAPRLLSYIVTSGTKHEWNIAMGTLIGSYILGAAVYGLFSSSKLAAWGKVEKKDINKNNNAA